ncbi:MAG: glycosyltransferase family 9 protein [Candidatus Krumholzibacteriota bacterium]|nr:glycosyltransferase family 9 protein [Candidatus Krumholzibacteriota bacterium]
MLEKNGVQKDLNILIIRFSSLGDLVLLDPLLKEIKMGFPQSKIDLATKSEYAEVFAPAPEIRTIFTLDGRGLTGLFTLYRKLRNDDYDIIIDAHNVVRSLLLTFFLNSGRVLRIKKYHSKKILLIRKKQNFFEGISPIRDRYLELAEGLGIRLSGKDHHLTIPEKAFEKADELIESAGFKNNSLIAIAPGARWDTKRWPEEYFHDLVSRLAQNGHTIVLIGDKSESSLCRRIADSENNLIDASGRLTVLETAAILRRCRLLVTNDSAPLHISEAAGTPVAALFGPTVKEFGFFPQMKNSKVIEIPLACRPCSRNGSKPCRFDTKECLSSIPVDKVLEAAMEILDDPGTAD